MGTGREPPGRGRGASFLLLGASKEYEAELYRAVVGYMVDGRARGSGQGCAREEVNAQGHKGDAVKLWSVLYGMLSAGFFIGALWQHGHSQDWQIWLGAAILTALWEINANTKAGLQ
jgi:hypothetical protein